MHMLLRLALFLLLAASPARAAIDGLDAAGPNPALGDRLKLFGQFVGNWDVEVSRSSNGVLQRDTGEWHFGWVLDGRAVQDVYIVPARSSGQPVREWGSSIRSFDPKTGTWYIAWVGPVQGTLQTFTARQQGDEIVHEGVTADGRPSRWIFRDIRPDSFRWQSLISSDHGTTWTLTQEIFARRHK
jgi:hypothetical protein